MSAERREASPIETEAPTGAVPTDLAGHAPGPEHHLAHADLLDLLDEGVAHAVVHASQDEREGHTPYDAEHGEAGAQPVRP